MNRREFLAAAAIGGALGGTAALPLIVSAQADPVAPSFVPAGTAETDPAGYEIAWSSDWERRDLTNLTFEPIPGTRGFLVLDKPPDTSVVVMHQRLVFQTDASSQLIDPEWLVKSFAEEYPALEMGYAPGTLITERHVTDRGCWFAFQSGTDSTVPGVAGLSLYYTPEAAGDPLLNLSLLIHDGFRTATHLEEIDSTVSINGGWLLGLDELGSFLAAIS